VRVDSLPLPAWVAETLRRLTATGTVELVDLQAGVSADTPIDLGQRLLAALGGVDRRLLALAPDPDRPVALAAEHGGTPRDDPQARPDLVLDLTSARSPELADTEIWRVRVGGHTALRLEPYFWCLYRSSNICEISVEAILPDGARSTVARAYSRVDRLSMARTRDPLLWKAAAMLERCLQQRARTGASPRVDPEPGPVESSHAGTPGPAQIAAWCVRAVARVARVRTRKALGRDTWYLALRPSSQLPDRSEAIVDALLAGGAFRRLDQPPDVFRADPFLFEHDGRCHLFFEEYSYAEGKAHIAVAEVEPDGSVSAGVPCLVRDYHLSYPFVFEHDGEIFLLPESAERRSVDLYRATRFPFEWTHDRALLSDLTALDPTLLRHEGRWWLFAGVVVPGAPSDDELSLFSAPALEGPWTPHPQNPIVVDVRCARPAGPLFWVGKDLIRPAQDGSLGYGSRISLRRVTELSESAYAEEGVGAIPPSWLPHAFATHTYGRTRSFEVTDGRGATLRPDRTSHR